MEVGAVCVFGNWDFAANEDSEKRGPSAEWAWDEEKVSRGKDVMTMV